MRNIIFFLIEFNAINVCQNLTGYYPLEIGNMWEYWDPYEQFTLFRTIITKDTVLSNNKVYKVQEIKYWDWDSSSISSFLVFEDNVLYSFSSDSNTAIYDFNKTVGDTIKVTYYPQDTIITKITADYEALIFEKKLRHIEFYTKSTNSSLYNIDRVADSIGLVFREHEPGIEYYLRGAIINGRRYGTITNVKDERINKESHILLQNYPNPFNYETRIEFSIPKQGFVSLKVYDILGRLVKVLKDSEIEAGWQQVIFNTDNLSGGVYFYTLWTNDIHETKKMIFLP